MLIQLDLFEQDEDVLIGKQIQKIQESVDKTRRALFARHGSLSKLYVELDSRLSIIERHICKGGK